MHIVWFRRDLRVSDNEALAAAVRSGGPVLPIHVQGGAWPTGAASRAWLARSLDALATELEARGSELIRLGGDPAATLAKIVAGSGAHHVHCTRDWTPAGLAEEKRVAEALAEVGAILHVSEGQLLATPESVRTADGRAFSVFTPFHRAWLTAWRPETPLSAPAKIPAPTRTPRSMSVPHSAGTLEIERWWTPGERGAHARLEAFLRDGLARYDAMRDVPSVHGTSELSPHLAFGEISPRQIVAAALALDDLTAAPFVRQLAWREFAAHVLLANPHTATRPLRPEFERFPWREDPAAFEAWKAGRTGFPLVDAGMRQLAATGWMHNRVRLVCGSFLAKDLLVPWQAGEEYFADRLVDHDPASNVFNWQWVAGSGADAAPYFRVFNPTLQAARFDPQATYARRWVPELGTGEYPSPIVDHAIARERALAAYAAVRRG